ncbi:MAG TPA: hypothetical protein VLF91_04175 [Candidatus Saccharimonadales bacterium]|nr:hypothetical protein [Candidatus Saccharimonadales bacterium]
MPRFKIQSVIVSPSGWLFSATTAKNISPNLSFKSPERHGGVEHIVTYECDAANLQIAWQDFYNEVEQFIRAMSFYTSSYLAFHDWRNLVIDNNFSVALISTFSRTYGTAIGIYSQNEADNINLLIERSNEDERLKNFLYNFKMALLTDAPETQNAYEKYLILAAESLAGKIEEGNGIKKLDRPRLKQIIGEDLHNFFFQHVDPLTGNNIRNRHMHEGESPASKPSETIKLVSKFKAFIKTEYGIAGMHEISEAASPTRGLYRDDGGLVMARAVDEKSDLSQINIEDTLDKESVIKWLLKGNFELLNISIGEGNKIYMQMLA